jgi:hypothetical protein
VGARVTNSDVRIISEFFPIDLLNDLISSLDSSEVRKWELDIDRADGQVGASVRRAAEYASERLGLKFNTAVLKWYRVDDEYESAAYEAHQDPPELRSIPLCLFTLRGAARLKYWGDDGVEEIINCTDNIALILRSDLRHQVSPPTGPSGERYFLFLGFRMRTGVE